MAEPDYPAPPSTAPSTPSSSPTLIADDRGPAPAALPARTGIRKWGKAWQRGLELALAALVLVFAFFAASVPVRNSDFWLHLASGRLLAEGGYHFGVDPFAYTTANVYWANHSWLFDWLLYGLYTGLGGAALVVLKALLVTGLAGLLLGIRRGGSGLVWPAVCTTLSLLAMSPRLLLQPACLSYFLLGLTLWMLWRPHARPAGRLRPYLLLLALFVLWVNVDSWFLLGPLLVGLFWLGERLQGLLPGPGGPARTPTWLVPASVAVCLLNPHHVHAFTLPAELSPVLTQAGLTQDFRFQRLLSSPWQVGLRPWPAAAGDLTAWAYFVLVGLGLASFIFERGRLSGWRLVVWLAFAALGAWQLRTVPFFAVVAGPITALNLQDYLGRRRDETEEGQQREWILGRAALVVLGLGVVAMAWAGWLQGVQLERGRAVGWGVQPDPSLERAAKTLAQWRGQEKLTADQRVFPFDPETADYMTWYCPGVKTFLDHRFGLFAQVAGEYEEVCRGLNPALEGGGRSGGGRGRLTGGWRKVFRDWGIPLVVLHDRHEPLLLSAVGRVAQNPEEWWLLEPDGQAVIVAWTGGKDSARFADLRFNPDRLAWQTPVEGSPLPAAPDAGPGRGPRDPQVWDSFTTSRPATPWESGASSVLLYYAQETAARDRQASHNQALSMYLAGLIGLPALPSFRPAVPGALYIRGRMAPLLLGEVMQRSPALPLLAVRTARRALAADPEDSNAYLRLGQAYLALRNESVERSREGLLPPLALLRHVQVATALEEALVLQPRLEAAHEQLAALYLERNYYDAALEHRRAQLRLARAGLAERALPQERAEALAAQLSQLEKSVTDLESLVQDRQNQFAIRAEALGDNPLRKAELALKLGLPVKALDDVLLQSKVLLFGHDGARLELQLLLLLGRAEEARSKLDALEAEGSGNLLGILDLPGLEWGGRPFVSQLPAYNWLVGCQAAATGDYERAVTTLRGASDEIGRQVDNDLRILRTLLPAAAASEIGLLAAPQASFFAALLAHKDLEAALIGLARLAQVRSDQADLEVVLGVLELERGRPLSAGESFRQALSLGSPGGLVDSFAGRSVATAYLQRLRAAGSK